jgi:hypothetical protein
MVATTEATDVTTTTITAGDATEMATAETGPNIQTATSETETTMGSTKLETKEDETEEIARTATSEYEAN